MTILPSYLLLWLSPYQSFYGHHTIYFACQEIIYTYLLAKTTSETDFNWDHKTLMASTHSVGPLTYTLPRCILFFPNADGESLMVTFFLTFCWTLLRYISLMINYTYLKYAIWWLVTYVYIHETIIIIKNISISTNISLCSFIISPFSPHPLLA